MASKANRTDPHPVRAAAAVIYGTLLLVWLAAPHSLTNWVKDIDPNTPRTALLRVTEGVELVSKRIGASWFYEQGRALFVRWTGKE